MTTAAGTPAADQPLGQVGCIDRVGAARRQPVSGPRRSRWAAALASVARARAPLEAPSLDEQTPPTARRLPRRRASQLVLAGTAVDALGDGPSRRGCRGGAEADPVSWRAIGAAAATFNTASIMVASTRWPRPVRSRSARATRAAKAAWRAATGSPVPPTRTGGPSAQPVAAAIPLTASMVWAKPGTVPPRAVEAEGRHAHQAQPGVERLEALPVQAELPITRGVKFSKARSAAASRASATSMPLGPAEVEGDAALVGVDRVGQSGPHSHHCGSPGALGPAKRIWSGRTRRLHLDHVGPQTGQELGGARAGPPGGEVDHPDAGERQPARSAPAGRAGRGGQSTVPSCSPGLGTGPNGPGARGRGGGRGCGAGGKRPDGLSTKTPRSTKWSKVSDRRRRRAPGPPGCAGGRLLDHLVGGARAGVGPRSPRRTRAVLEAGEVAGVTARSVAELGVAQQACRGRRTAGACWW